MPTPPMLRSRGSGDPAVSRGPDPVVWLAVILMAIVAGGLALAAVLAVYDVATPPVLEPVVVVIAGVFAVTVLLIIVGAAVRHARRLGR